MTHHTVWRRWKNAMDVLKGINRLKGQSTLSGIGALACSELLTMFEQASSEDEEHLRALGMSALEWTLGFTDACSVLRGVNLAAGLNIDVLIPMILEGCASHPEMPFGTMILQQLTKRMIANDPNLMRKIASQ